LTAFIKGEEEERTRLSRELHDGIAAMISAAKMNLESIPYLSEEEKMPQISRVKSVLEATHDEIRFIAHNLMPEKLQEEGLVGALRSHIKTIHDSGLLGISFSTDQETYPNLRIQTQQMFYRIIQELINNIVKHSQATKAEVKIYTQQDGKICFEISDNGNGTDKSKLEKGQGLTEIKKRLNLIGADFDFRSQPNTGTKVYIEYKPD
jgi:signal transduction histidine kinase